MKRNGRPSGPGTVPWTGSNSSVPAKASAVTISGLVRNESVAALPSFRPGKFRLNEDTMVLVSSRPTSERRHWPMQGPQALASTLPPIRSNVSMIPSRLMVWKIRSDPGVIMNGVFARSPALMPCMATCAARRMSSYEEFVHEPIRVALISAGQRLARTSAPSFETGRARSGEWGPTM